MNGPPISAVIPAYNAERFIQQAIDSVFAQTLPVAELILVADDCSDRTAEIARQAGARVVPISSRNISAARNRGIEAALHPWIAFLDADDFWKPQKIELQWRAIEAFPSARVISCDCELMFESEIVPPSDDEILQRHQQATSDAVVTKDGTYFPRVDGKVLFWFAVAPQAAMIKKDVTRTAGFFDEGLIFLQDIEFFARALRSHSLVVIESPLVTRRIRNDSHSADLDGKWAAYLSIVNRMLRCPDEYATGAGTEYRQHIKMVFAGNEFSFAQKRARLKRESEVQLSKPNQP